MQGTLCAKHDAVSTHVYQFHVMAIRETTNNMQKQS